MNVKYILVLLLTFMLVACPWFAAQTEVYVYKSKTTGKLLYCSNDQGDDLKDFELVGKASVDSTADIRLCELENNP